jgi:hypothetical protein
MISGTPVIAPESMSESREPIRQSRKEKFVKRMINKITCGLAMDDRMSQVIIATSKVREKIQRETKDEI